MRPVDRRVKADLDKGLASMEADLSADVAELLNDPERWHSHGRAIDRETLRNEVNLKIDDLEEHETLYYHLRDYFELLEDYMRRESTFSFIHSKGYF